MSTQQVVSTTTVVIDVPIGDVFAIGELVPISGLYACLPCGYTQQFYAGYLFPTCDACLAGTNLGPEGFQEPEAEFCSFID